MMLRRKWFAGLAKQLGHPTGIRGRFIGAMLNSRNRANVTEAVSALSLVPGAVAADIGFGGGVGLAELLKAVDRFGQVHGVELSQTMLTAATGRFRQQIAAGRLRLHAASMLQMPLADGQLDGAITVNTIYFIQDLDTAFAELARIMKTSGRLVVGLADPAAMAKLPFTAYGFRFRSLPEVIEVLHRAGLPVEDDRRVGDGDEAYHLLVTTVAEPG